MIDVFSPGGVVDAIPSIGTQSRRAHGPPMCQDQRGSSERAELRRAHTQGKTATRRRSKHVAQLSPEQDLNMVRLCISDLAASCQLGAHADEKAINWSELDNLEQQFSDSSVVGPILGPESRATGVHAKVPAEQESSNKGLGVVRGRWVRNCEIFMLVLYVSRAHLQPASFPPTCQTVGNIRHLLNFLTRRTVSKETQAGCSQTAVVLVSRR